MGMLDWLVPGVMVLKGYSSAASGAETRRWGPEARLLVVLTWGKLLISSHETQEAAEAEAKRLNDLCLVSPEQEPYYRVISRPPQGG